MYKKIYLALLAAGAMVTATSCSNEDVAPVGDGGNVSFEVSLPQELATRAFGDGKQALQLTYAVYESGTKDPLQVCPVGDGTFTTEGKATFVNLKTTVNVTLANHMSYDIVFWADTPDNTVYDFKIKDQTITVDYDNVVLNNENQDAFFNHVTITNVSGPINQTVYLRRPFAQVNIGTSDIEEAKRAGMKLDSMEASVNVNGIFNTLNLMTGDVTNVNGTEVSTDGATYSWPLAAFYPTEEQFPYQPKDENGNTVQTYDYLTMNYILVPVDKTNVDVTLNLTGKENFGSYTNVPVQRNYRTNIFGALLTSPSIFNVEIVPEFDGAYDYPVAIKDIESGDSEGLAEALQNPDVTEINVDGDVDISDIFPSLNPTPAPAARSYREPMFTDWKGCYALPGPKTINIKNGATITMGANQFLSTEYDLTINGGTISNGDVEIATRQTEEFVSQGAMTLIVTYGGTLTLSNTKLVNNPNYHWHGTTAPGFNTAAVQYYNSGTINVENSEIISGMFTLCGMVRGDNDAIVNLKNSRFESTSSVIQNRSNWAYALRVFGSECTVDNCEVTGIQGALSVDDECLCTINSGIFTTHNSPGQQDAFYALYITDAAQVTVNGGYFYGATKQSNLCGGSGATSAIVCGNNDTGLPAGSVIINGGYMSGMAYNTETKSVYEPINGMSYDLVNYFYDVTGLTYMYWVH